MHRKSQRSKSLVVAPICTCGFQPMHPVQFLGQIVSMDLSEEQCFRQSPKAEVYLHPDRGFWTQLIANGNHTENFGHFGLSYGHKHGQSGINSNIGVDAVVAYNGKSSTNHLNNRFIKQSLPRFKFFLIITNY